MSSKRHPSAQGTDHQFPYGRLRCKRAIELCIYNWRSFSPRDQGAMLASHPPVASATRFGSWADPPIMSRALGNGAFCWRLSPPPKCSRPRSITTGIRSATKVCHQMESTRAGQSRMLTTPLLASASALCIHARNRENGGFT